MFCNRCGNQMDDAARFCPACGAPNAKLAQQEAAAVSDSQSQQPDPATAQAQPQQPGSAAADGRTQQVPAPDTAATAQVPPAFDWNATSASTSTPPQTPGGFYPKGCLAQAFDDITKVPGAMKRVMQIAFLPAIIALVSLLVLIIPVIGWIACPIGLVISWIAGICCNGYAIEWGRELSRGRGFDTNASILRTSLFSLGFFSSSLSGALSLIALLPSLIAQLLMVLGGAASIGAWAYSSSYGYGDTMGGLSGILIILSLVTMLLYIVSFVLGILFTMFSDAAVMHLAVTGRVESAFSFGKVWQPYKKQLGKLFCASLLPGIITGAILAVVVLILVGILLAIVAGSAYNGYYGSGIAGALLSGGFGMIVVLALIVFAVAFMGAFTSMLKYRAVGYWAQRYADAWTHEGDEDYTFRLPGGQTV